MNNPIRFNDPTGHVCSDPESAEAGNLVCYGSGTTRVGDRMVRGNGAELGKAKNLNKISEEGREDLRDEEVDDHWPSNPSWDSNPTPIDELELIDIIFNPWAGPSYGLVLRNPAQFRTYVDMWRQLMFNGMYGEDGYTTLRRLTIPPYRNNPLASDKYPGMEATLLIRVGWEPYNIFLDKLGLDTGHNYTSNYEPYYLEALMVDNPDVLDDAKTTWLLEHSLSPDDPTIKDFLDTNFCAACE